MKKRSLVILMVAALIIGLPEMAAAQSPGVTVVDGTTPISSEMRTALEGYLNANPPYPASYFAVTFVKDDGSSSLVSLAALNLSSPDEAWRMEAQDGDTSPSKVLWIGTIRLYPDGSGEPYSTDPPIGYIPHLASPLPALLNAGGGSYVNFPFDRSAMYGPRGVHGSGDYGTSGMRAVDFVGGSSLGSNTMSDRAYASDTGTVDYVCEDGTTVAIRTYNSTTGDYFIYAHLLDNANLVSDHVFTKGSVIGTLKHGSFDDTCGWAEQDSDIYHVHWMFTPSDNVFRVEMWTLKIGDGKFYSGDTTVRIGGWLQHVGIIGGGADDPTGQTQAPSFWDNIVNAIVSFVGSTLAPLPEHDSPTQLLRMLVNGVDLVFRLVYVFAKGNLNLVPLIIILAIVLLFRLLLGVIWVIWWLVRALYNIIPGAA